MNLQLYRVYEMLVHHRFIFIDDVTYDDDLLLSFKEIEYTLVFFPETNKEHIYVDKIIHRHEK